MSKVVKNIYTGTLYQKWTEVSDFLACGLVDVEVKDKSELTKEEFNLYCQEVRTWAMSEFNFVLEEPKK